MGRRFGRSEPASISTQAGASINSNSDDYVHEEVAVFFQQTPVSFSCRSFHDVFSGAFF